MSEPAQLRATYADLAELLESLVAELIDDASELELGALREH